MKRYLFKILRMGLCLVMPFVLFFAYIHTLPSYGDKSIGATIRYKIDLIEQTEGERVILVGGSSSPYGTICTDIEKELERPCINIGATAYLGLEYYINILEKYSKPGDIIVIAPEHMLLMGESIDYTTMWISVGSDIDAIKCVPYSYYSGMFSSFYDYSKLRYDNRNKEENNGIHDHFGPKGDVVIGRESLLASGYNTQDIITFSSEKIFYDNLDLINRFYKKAEEQNIKVFFAYAPVDKLAIASSKESNMQFEHAVSEYVNTPVILDFETAVMEAEYFYDTNNHLTSEGAKIYTANLIEGLKKNLNKAN